MTAGRNGLADYGLLLAVLGIVWFHTQAPGYRVAYIALPFFLVLLSMPASASLAAAARRLLLPFLAWSVIYALLQTVLAIKHQNPPFGWWRWDMLLTGTWLHLWFLPFAFLATLASPWLRHPMMSLGGAMLAAVLIVVQGTPDQVPFSQWVFGIIPLLVGIAYFTWGWELATTTLVTSTLILFLGRTSPDTFTILAGTGLALMFLSFHLPATPSSDWCGRVSLSVYLAHPLAIIVGQSLQITYIELGLFSLVGSVLLAQLIEAGLQTSRNRRQEV